MDSICAKYQNWYVIWNFYILDQIKKMVADLIGNRYPRHKVKSCDLIVEHEDTRRYRQAGVGEFKLALFTEP